MSSNVRTIAVLGAGDMGHGIAELAALKGFDVRLRDVDAAALERGLGRVRWSLEKLVAHATVTKAEASDALGRIRGTTDLTEAVAGADLVLEAVPEILDLKRRVLREVEAAAPPGAILATNTSGLRVGEIAEGLADPSRLVGMHFFNPVLLLSLVEVIPAERTSPAAVEAAVDVSRRLGKETVVLRRDTPGFVTTRLVATWVGASIVAHERGLAAPEAVDSALRYKAGFPMGPIELADYTGLDVGFHVAEYLRAKLGPAYAPTASLAERVKRGDLGKKTERGFYAWKDGQAQARFAPDLGAAFDPALVLSVVANEAARLVAEGVAPAEDVDKAMRLGCAFPKGPLAWADEHGLDRVVETLRRVHSETGAALAEPAPLLLQLVAEGRTGKAAGRGFHEHAAGGAAAATYATVQVEVDADARVGTIRLNRPQRLHAINDELVRDLDRALADLEADARVRVVVLTGAGEKAFCVGADLQEGPVTPPVAMEASRRGHAVCRRIEDLGKPVVAAVNGYAFGGGLELALACDFRVAARRAKVALPEVTLGLIPGMGGTQRLPKLVGLARAKEIVLFGDRLDAEEAHRLGIVHRVFENATFEADAHAYAKRLAERAPVALRLAKRLLNAAPTTELATGIELEAGAFAVASSTEDVVEGVTSMFMKKTPDFKGQ